MRQLVGNILCHRSPERADPNPPTPPPPRFTSGLNFNITFLSYLVCRNRLTPVMDGVKNISNELKMHLKVRIDFTSCHDIPIRQTLQRSPSVVSFLHFLCLNAVADPGGPWGPGPPLDPKFEAPDYILRPKLHLLTHK